ncbi:hypothetical protein CRUP_022899 [Coryphaenoides rupestris]|nr:hypothetical protein CRUP_022899 [Coryphaenoides rupestris]
MMVVGFLGCCGAIQESPCMLGLFFFFLLILFAVEVAAGIWGFSNQSQIVNDITKFYTETYNNYIKGDDRLKETLRVIQTGSCLDAIDEVFDSKLHIIGGVGLSVAFVMMFGMIFSMLLCCAIRKSREVV